MYLKFLILVWLITFSLFSNATKLVDINVGRVTIDDQTSATQSKAGRAALRQVFIKMSGSEQTASDPAIRRAIVNYEQYLVASSFVQHKDQLMFEARFNQEKLNTLLKATGLPIWASLRPSATLWFAQQTSQGDIRWFNQNTAREFNQELQQLAFERGVSIVLPLGDLKDAMVVSDFDVWSQNTAKLIPQTMRYDTVFTISATLTPITPSIRQKYSEQAAFRAQQDALERLFNAPLDDFESKNSVQTRPAAPLDDEFFQLDWIFSNAKKVNIGSRFLNNEGEAVAFLVKEYADMLAKQYAVSGDKSSADAQTTILTMQNVTTLSDFNQALALIKTMPQVNSIVLHDVKGGQANFVVSLNSDITEFVNLIALDKRIAESYATEPGQSNIQLMWRP